MDQFVDGTNCGTQAIGFTATDPPMNMSQCRLVPLTRDQALDHRFERMHREEFLHFRGGIVSDRCDNVSGRRSSANYPSRVTWFDKVDLVKDPAAMKPDLSSNQDQSSGYRICNLVCRFRAARVPLGAIAGWYLVSPHWARGRTSGGVIWPSPDSRSAPPSGYECLNGCWRGVSRASSRHRGNPLADRICDTPATPIPSLTLGSVTLR